MTETTKHRCGLSSCNQQDCWDCYPTLNDIRAGNYVHPEQSMTPQELAAQNVGRWDAFGGVEQEEKREKVMEAMNKAASSCPDVMMDPPPSETQVGGDHYTRLRIDPLELKYRRCGYEGVKHSLDVKVDKYLQRQKGCELTNLRKARHCVDLMIEYYEREHS